MPILDVEVVGTLERRRRRGIAARLADAAAGVFKAGPQTTWVRYRELSRADYAENGGGPPAGVAPVFVSVLHGRCTTGTRCAQQAAALTRALAEVLGRPFRIVHVLFRANAVGRIAS